MGNIFDQMEEDFEASLTTGVEKLDQDGLKTVAELARKIRDEERVYKRVLRMISRRLKKGLQKLTDEDLPTMLQEIGLSSMKLDDGSEVVVKPTYGASITKGEHGTVDNRPAAYQWFTGGNGYDDIIKKYRCVYVLAEGRTNKRQPSKPLRKKRAYIAEQGHG